MAKKKMYKIKKIATVNDRCVAPEDGNIELKETHAQIYVDSGVLEVVKDSKQSSSASSLTTKKGNKS